MFLAIPKHLLSEPKVQCDLNPNGVKKDSRLPKSKALLNSETENKTLKGIFIRLWGGCDEWDAL